MEMMKDIHLEIRKWSQKSTVADYQLITDPVSVFDQ